MKNLVSYFGFVMMGCALAVACGDDDDSGGSDTAGGVGGEGGEEPSTTGGTKSTTGGTKGTTGGSQSTAGEGGDGGAGPTTGGKAGTGGSQPTAGEGGDGGAAPTTGGGGGESAGSDSGGADTGGSGGGGGGAPAEGGTPATGGGGEGGVPSTDEVECLEEFAGPDPDYTAAIGETCTSYCEDFFTVCGEYAPTADHFSGTEDCESECNLLASGDLCCRAAHIAAVVDDGEDLEGHCEAAAGIIEEGEPNALCN